MMTGSPYFRVNLFKVMCFSNVHVLLFNIPICLWASVLFSLFISPLSFFHSSSSLYFHSLVCLAVICEYPMSLKAFSPHWIVESCFLCMCDVTSHVLLWLFDCFRLSCVYVRFKSHVFFIRDAPKLKFLAEAEQNETLGPKAEYRTRFFKNSLPHVGLFCNFFHYCIN